MWNLNRAQKENKMSKNNKSKGKGQKSISDDFGPPLGAPRRRNPAQPATQPAASAASAWGQPAANISSQSSAWGQPKTTVNQTAASVVIQSSQPRNETRPAQPPKTSAWGQSGTPASSRPTVPATGQPGQSSADQQRSQTSSARPSGN